MPGRDTKIPFTANPWEGLHPSTPTPSPPTHKKGRTTVGSCVLYLARFFDLADWPAHRQQQHAANAKLTTRYTGNIGQRQIEPPATRRNTSVGSM